MLISREFLADIGFGVQSCDKLKTSQSARDDLCSLLKLPTGTSILDARWDYNGSGIDRFGFLIAYPDFPEVPEGHVMPNVNAVYTTVTFTNEPQFAGWQFMDTYGVPLEQCEWFRKMGNREENGVPPT